LKNKQRKAKRVLLIAPYTFPYTAGGGINAFNFAKFLSTQNLRVELMSFNRNFGFKYHEKEEGISICRVPYLNKNIFLKLLSLLAILPIYFFKVFKNHSLIIYGGYIIGWEMIILFGRLLNKRVIFRSTMYGEDDVGSILGYRRTLKPLRRLAINGITHYFSLTPAFSKSYLENGGNPAKLIETTQGVDPKWLSVTRSLEQKNTLQKKLGLSADKLIIVSIGILLGRKGYVKIFNSLKKLDIPFVYIVLGEYQLSEEHHIHQHSNAVTRIFETGKKVLGEKIHFTGFTDKVDEFLSGADLFLTGSSKEGLPNALLEAMATGIPCIVKKINQIEGYLLMHRENCLLFNTYSQMLSEIELLYNNRVLREKISLGARRTINRSHTFFHAARKLSLLENV
jgi:glycosyltransferase involved in cell wall biosynthesis